MNKRFQQVQKRHFNNLALYIQSSCWFTTCSPTPPTLDACVGEAEEFLASLPAVHIQISIEVSSLRLPRTASSVSNPTAQTHPMAALVGIGLLRFRLFVLVDHVLAAWPVFA